MQTRGYARRRCASDPAYQIESQCVGSKNAALEIEAAMPMFDQFGSYFIHRCLPLQCFSDGYAVVVISGLIWVLCVCVNAFGCICLCLGTPGAIQLHCEGAQ